MLAALSAAVLFAISAIFGYRSSRQIGGAEANFWRICVALLFLGLWAHIFGQGLAGTAFPLFFVSGFFGIGLGDTGFFQALPRLGSRRTVLLTQCIIPLFAILIEWLRLGTILTRNELLCVVIILAGVSIALAPSDHAKIPAGQMGLGVFFALFGAFCGALGAVYNRKAFFVAHLAGEHPDPGTANYQRVIGGVLVPAIILLSAKWQTARAHGGVLEEKTMRVSREKWQRLWPSVVGNSLAGQTLGVSCMQWAFERTPAGIVLAVTAMTPVILLPMTRIVDGEKIGIRSLTGAIIAVAGVAGLAHFYVR